MFSSATRLDRLDTAGIGDRWQVPAVAEAIGHHPDFYFTPLIRVTSPRWSRGRVTLLGDAAWSGSPLTGRGTAMAVMGAEALADAIARHLEDLPRAAGEYEHRMRRWRRWGHARGTSRTLRAWAPMTRREIARNAALMRMLTAGRRTFARQG